MGDVLDSIDWKFYSAVDGITTFENALRVGMSWRHQQVLDEDFIQDFQM